MTDNPSNTMPMQPIPNDIYPFDPNESLTSFLSRDSDGMCILNEFYCKKRLSVTMKNVLSRKIISREIDILLRLKGFKCGDKVDKFEISTERFTSLAEQIAQTFQESSAVYYTPFVKRGAKSVNASGKLWERFSAEKTNLKDRGILKSDDTPPTSAEVSSNVLLKLNWLKRSLTPWHKVQKYWHETTEERLKQVEDNITDEIVYFQYSCVRKQEGTALIQSDFEYLYSTKSLLLYNNWKKYQSFLKDYTNYILEPKTIVRKKTQTITFKSDKDKVLYDLVEKLPTLTGDSLHALGLKILTYLLSLTTANVPAEKKRKLSKPTDLEKLKFEDIQESFILQVNESADIENRLKDKQKEANRRNITLQPFLLLVGTEEEISKSYVVYENIKYECDSVLDALDLNFKIFFVSDCDYPILTNKVWLFIQEALYDIRTTKKLGTQIESMLHFFRN